MSWLWKTALVLAALYGLLLASACAVQSKFIYFPDASRAPPGQVGLALVEDVELETADGERVVTWRGAPRDPDGPVILYFQGNAANLANRAPVFAMFQRAGWGLAALSYRGYGGSTGSPSEAANVADALALYDQLIAEGARAEQIVVFGESLGTGIAVQLAAQREIAGLVLSAPYASLADIAADRAPFLAPRLLLRDQYRSIDHIADVRAPLLWIHGEADAVIPIRYGQALFDAAGEPKTAFVVEGAGHNDLYGRDVFTSATQSFVEGLFAGGR